MELMVSIAAYAAAAYFLYNGIQDGAILELLLAAVLSGVGKANIRRYKEKK